jgi:DDE_Tnp_1-associated
MTTFKERLKMDYTTLTAEENIEQDLSQEQTHSLYEICKQIADTRAARGKQYDLAGLLMALILAKLAGMKSLLGASDWVRDQEERLRERLKLSWKHMPYANT